MNAILARLASLALLAGMTLPTWAGDWPQWHGPTRNGYASADAPPITSLPKELKPVWKLSIGGGFSAPIVAGDKLVYLDERDGKEVAHLILAGSGNELWPTPYAHAFGDEWGAGPPAAPLIHRDRL